MAQELQGNKAAADAQLSSEMGKALWMNWYWPSNIATFLLDQMTETDFMKAATSSDAKKTGISQGWYYAGMRHLLAGNKSAAADDFKKCLAANNKDERTSFFAQTELRAIGQ